MGKLNDISSVYVDEQGLVYVADSSSSSGKVVVYKNVSGRYDVVSCIPSYTFVLPTDLCLDKHGWLYVCDGVKNELWKYNLNDEASLAKPVVFNASNLKDKMVVRLDDLNPQELLNNNYKLDIKGDISAKK